MKDDRKLLTFVPSLASLSLDSHHCNLSIATLIVTIVTLVLLFSMPSKPFLQHFSLDYGETSKTDIFKTLFTQVIN